MTFLISSAAIKAGIGRATVYRTLQWMVEGGLARKVDFGEGRSRFEPSYRRPRHFHLICDVCHRSSEFLSSDVESMVEEVAAAARLHAFRNDRPDPRHVRGRAAPARPRRQATSATTEPVFARDALRMAIATETSGLQFYKRAASLDARPARQARVCEACRGRARASRDASEALSRARRRRSAARVASDISILQRRRQRALRVGCRTAEAGRRR